MRNIRISLKAQIFILLYIFTYCISEGHAQTKQPMDATQGIKHQKNILLLHSYHKGFQWTSDINEAICETLKDEKKIHSFSEYMDTKKHESKAYFEILKELYKYKYPKGYIDAIICSDNSALDFVIEYGDEIWGNIPVSFCGINNANSYRQKVDTTRIKGVAENIEITTAVKTALKINPQITDIIFVTDSTLTGTILMQEAQKAAAAFNVQFIYLDDAQDFVKRIEKTDFRNKMVFILSLYSKQNKLSNELSKEIVYDLNRHDALIMGSWDFLLNGLSIGGQVIRAKDQGEEAALIMVEMLNNLNNRAFLTETKYVWMADEKKCFEKSIVKSVFPPNTIWVNRKTSWLSENEDLLFNIFLGINFFLLLSLLFFTIKRKQKKAESSWAESEKRLEIALEAAAGGLWDVLISKKQLFISTQFARLLGYNSVEELDLSFENWTKLIFSNDLEIFTDKIYLHYTRQTPKINADCRFIKSTGEPVWFAIYGKITEWSSDGKPERVTGIIININQQKEFEEQLKQAKEKAEISDRLKSSFLANMSHEIRTPMNAIIGFTEIVMTQENTQEDQQQFLNIIKNSGDTLLNLINDIIDISKIESGYMNISIEKFQLVEIVESIKNIIANQISTYEKDIKFYITSHPELADITIESDPLRIKQILLNLCTNAVKFTDTGYIELNIIHTEHQVKFSVKDTGTGIPPNFVNTIFDRFRQVDENSFRKFSGTGLGLSITKSLVNMLKGEISVTTQLGHGSTFTVTIPLPTTEISNKPQVNAPVS